MKACDCKYLFNFESPATDVYVCDYALLYFPGVPDRVREEQQSCEC